MNHVRKRVLSGAVACLRALSLPRHLGAVSLLLVVALLFGYSTSSGQSTAAASLLPASQVSSRVCALYLLSG